MFLIRTRVIVYSETVKILVGKEKKETVNVHKDLLTLHSTYFTNLFSEKGRDVDKKIAVSVEPPLFADFVSWIYTGEFLKVEKNALAGGAHRLDLGLQPIDDHPRAEIDEFVRALGILHQVDHEFGGAADESGGTQRAARSGHRQNIAEI